MKKHLEAPSRNMLAAQIREEERPILCINVSRYLPKEKEETNFLYEETRRIGQGNQEGKQKRKLIPCGLYEMGAYIDRYG